MNTNIVENESVKKTLNDLQLLANKFSDHLLDDAFLIESNVISIEDTGLRNVNLRSQALKRIVSGQEGYLENKTWEALIVILTGAMVVTKELDSNDTLDSLKMPGWICFAGRNVSDQLLVCTKAEIGDARVAQFHGFTSTSHDDQSLSVSSFSKFVSIFKPVPETWHVYVFTSQFSNSEENQHCDDESDGDFNEDYETCPEYVVSVPGEEDVLAMVSMEILGHQTYGEQMGFDIYGVPGEDYEMSDDPRVFWTLDNICNTTEPATHGCGYFGCEIQFRCDFIYTIVPRCTVELPFAIRIASEQSLDVDSFDDDDEDEDEGDDSDDDGNVVENSDDDDTH